MNELSSAVDIFLYSNRIKKVEVADKLGMTKQTFHKFMNKSNFTVDDANKVLNAVGYEIKFDIVPKND